MKLLFIVFAVVALATSHRIDEDDELEDFNIRDVNLRSDYVRFVRKFKKTGSLRSNSDVKKRFRIFAHNAHKIKEHNRMGGSYRQEINEFTDRTLRERRSFTGLANVTESLKKRSFARGRRSALNLRETSPSAYDHRDYDHVTGISNQGECGSCWTYGTVYPLEGAISILSGKRAVELSQQEILSCSYESDEDRNGCNGGWYMDGWDYVQEAGHLSLAADEPYIGFDMHCDPDIMDRSNGMAGYKVTGYERVPKADDNALQLFSSKHVIAVAVESIGLFFYGKGVFKDPYCESPAAVDHAVTLVGYSGEAWIVKNSWGENWGEHGYVRMSREFPNHCGISDYAYFPVVEPVDEE